jgi:hypothetical protein
MIKTYSWIIPIVESCVTPEQLNIAKIVVAQFVKLYPGAEEYHETLGRALSAKEVMMMVV